MVSIPAAKPGRQVPDPDMAFVGRLRRTRTAFYMLCGYLLAQSFQIPLFPIGSSWAIWPTFSDGFAAMLILCFITGYRDFKSISMANSRILNNLTLILCATFFVLIAIHSANLIRGTAVNPRASSFGIFQFYRLMEFTLIFRIAAGIPITPRRLRTLSKSVGAALLMAVIGLVGTYTSIIKTSRLASHLPSDFSTAGPWAYLTNTQLRDVGAIGYNHAYTALQIIMLAALYLALQTRRSRVLVILCLIAAFGGIFLTGSRAGMAAVLFFLAAYFLRRPSTLIVAGAISILLLLGARSVKFHNINFDPTMEREMTLADPLDPRNLSGRRDIWRRSLEFIRENPVRAMVGAGPGSASEMGTNAHMLFLQILLEGGLVGLIIFGRAAYTVLHQLQKQKSRASPILWATVALLISSLTQETFYPVPAFGHFLGFYLCSVAIILNPCRQVTAAWKQPYACNHRNAVLQLGEDAR